jgi:hypothetical protein
MKRFPALFLRAGLLAFFFMWLCAPTVLATSQARLHAANTAFHHVAVPKGDDRDADFTLVKNAYISAGVDMSGVVSAVDLLQPAVASPLLSLSAPPPQGPAPGDFALWVDKSFAPPGLSPQNNVPFPLLSSASHGHLHVAIFISNNDLSVYSQSQHAFITLMHAQVSGDTGDVAHAPITNDSSFPLTTGALARWCRRRPYCPRSRCHYSCAIHSHTNAVGGGTSS